MSHIEKMSIQGIRSFGPDDSDKQILKFYSPLTLILGPNGTGKTTIIECLKYICTGSTPAGGKLQSTFIHDPKIAHESTVKAQVRLQFRNITDDRCVIQRSMMGQQQAKNIKMTSLDGVISIRRPDGENDSITSRCADLDREMVSLLGVGKPVIESVIFCHQEDSCWPLSEGKALKQKFDDIFASTRYVKALENILKTRKDMQVQIKECQAEIKYLKQNKETADQMQSDLEQTKARFAASREASEEIQEKLAPIEEKLVNISTREGDILKLHTEIEKLKSERDQMERAQKELRDNIQNEFSGTTEELEDALAEFGQKVKGKEGTLLQNEQDVEKVDSKINRVTGEKSSLLREMGKLEQEEQQHRKNVQRRDKYTKQIAAEYDFPEIEGNLTDEQVQQFQEQLEEQRLQLQKEGRKQRELFEGKENKIQLEIDEIRKQISAHETEIRLKEEAIRKNTSEVKAINQKLARIAGSSSRLSEIKGDLEDKKQELQQEEKSVNLEELKLQIEQLSAQKSDLEYKFKKLDDELGKMHQESNARTKLDMLKKDRGGKEDQIRKIMAKNEDDLTSLLGNVPTERVRRVLEEFIENLEKEDRKDTKTLTSLRMEHARKTEEQRSIREQISKKEAELQEYEEKIQAECDGQNFDDSLVNLDENLKELREKKGIMEGAKAVFADYKGKLRREKPPCPLCRRLFEEESEVAELIDELDRKLRALPQKLETVDADIQDKEQKYNRVLQLKPFKCSIEELREVTIPKLQTRMSETIASCEKLNTRLTEMDRQSRKKQADLSLAKSLLPDIAMIDRYNLELKDLNKKIVSQSASLSGGENNRTLQQVQRERTDVQENLDTVRNSYERKQRRLTESERRLSQLNASINDLNAERLAIERDLQEQKENEQKRDDLVETNEVLSVEVHECKEQIEPLKSDLRKLAKDRERVSAEKDAANNAVMEKTSKIQESTRDIGSLQKEIERYTKAGRDVALQECRDKVKQLALVAEDLENKRASICLKIDKLRKELQSQKIQERELQDNLMLRRKQQDIEEKKDKISTKKERLGGLDVGSLEREKQKLRRQQDDLIKQRHQAEGREQGLMDQIRTFKKSLESDQYKDAEKKYCDKNIKLRTTELASNDLEKYYKALDRTIMSYHNMKISDINKIIRELWRNTYRGNDIETIEIRSDEDETSAVGKRRTFNYRVVMIKGDAAIDMRGRCSAGQKVLASLIIRLALAETFCLNCGVLALDEPTTNLDRENIESLAYALVEIIKSRSKQKNFQLIVITHDEDFVELLGRSDFVEKFVKVRKNDFGCSQLVEARVGELGTR